MAQSEELAAETGVMRRFDGALQAAEGLPARTRKRVLRYVAERLSDELAAGNGADTPEAPVSFSTRSRTPP